MTYFSLYTSFRLMFFLLSLYLALGGAVDDDEKGFTLFADSKCTLKAILSKDGIYILIIRCWIGFIS